MEQLLKIHKKSNFDQNQLKVEIKNKIKIKMENSLLAIFDEIPCKTQNITPFLLHITKNNYNVFFVDNDKEVDSQDIPEDLSHSGIVFDNNSFLCTSLRP